MVVAAEDNPASLAASEPVRIAVIGQSEVVRRLLDAIADRATHRKSASDGTLLTDVSLASVPAAAAGERPVLFRPAELGQQLPAAESFDSAIVCYYLNETIEREESAIRRLEELYPGMPVFATAIRNKLGATAVASGPSSPSQGDLPDGFEKAGAKNLLGDLVGMAGSHPRHSANRLLGDAPSTPVPPMPHPPRAPKPQTSTVRRSVTLVETSASEYDEGFFDTIVSSYSDLSRDLPSFESLVRTYGEEDAHTDELAELQPSLDSSAGVNHIPPPSDTTPSENLVQSPVNDSGRGSKGSVGVKSETDGTANHSTMAVIDFGLTVPVDLFERTSQPSISAPKGFQEDNLPSAMNPDKSACGAEPLMLPHSTVRADADVAGAAARKCITSGEKKRVTFAETLQQVEFEQFEWERVPPEQSTLTRYWADPLQHVRSFIEAISGIIVKVAGGVTRSVPAPVTNYGETNGSISQTHGEGGSDAEGVSLTESSSGVFDVVDDADTISNEADLPPISSPYDEDARTSDFNEKFLRPSSSEASAHWQTPSAAPPEPPVSMHTPFDRLSESSELSVASSQPFQLTESRWETGSCDSWLTADSDFDQAPAPLPFVPEGMVLHLSDNDSRNGSAASPCDADDEGSLQDSGEGENGSGGGPSDVPPNDQNGNNTNGADGYDENSGGAPADNGEDRSGSGSGKEDGGKDDKDKKPERHSSKTSDDGEDSADKRSGHSSLSVQDTQSELTVGSAARNLTAAACDPIEVLAQAYILKDKSGEEMNIDDLEQQYLETCKMRNIDPDPDLVTPPVTPLGESTMSGSMMAHCGSEVDTTSLASMPLFSSARGHGTRCGPVLKESDSDTDSRNAVFSTPTPNQLEKSGSAISDVPDLPQNSNRCSIVMKQKGGRPIRDPEALVHPPAQRDQSYVTLHPNTSTESLGSSTQDAPGELTLQEVRRVAIFENLKTTLYGDESTNPDDPLDPDDDARDGLYLQVSRVDELKRNFHQEIKSRIPVDNPHIREEESSGEKISSDDFDAAPKLGAATAVELYDLPNMSCSDSES